MQIANGAVEETELLFSGDGIWRNQDVVSRDLRAIIATDYVQAVIGGQTCFHTIWNPIGSGYTLIVDALQICSGLSATLSFGLANAKPSGTARLIYHKRDSLICSDFEAVSGQAAAPFYAKEGYLLCSIPNTQVVQFEFPWIVTEGFGFTVGVEQVNIDLYSIIEGRRFEN